MDLFLMFLDTVKFAGLHLQLFSWWPSSTTRFVQGRSPSLAVPSLMREPRHPNSPRAASITGSSIWAWVVDGRGSRRTGNNLHSYKITAFRHWVTFFSSQSPLMSDKNVIEVFSSFSALSYFECWELFCGGCFKLHLKLHPNNLYWTRLLLEAVSHHQVNGCISMSPWYISTSSPIKHSGSCECTFSAAFF